MRMGALAPVSRMTRPVKSLARGRQAGQAATVQCLAEQTGPPAACTTQQMVLVADAPQVDIEQSFSGRGHTTSRWSRPRRSMALDCNVPSHERNPASAESAARSLDAMPRQDAEDHLRRRHLQDLVDQGSAYACPMHAHARPPRRAASTRPPPRNRSSAATSQRAHPAYACVRSVDKAPRKTPERLGSSTRPRTRTGSHEKGRCQAVHFAPGRRLAPGADGVTVERPERAKAREDERP
jgi:hypothetical protein